MTLSYKDFHRFVDIVILVQELPMKTQHFFQRLYSRHLIITTFSEISDQNGSYGLLITGVWARKSVEMMTRSGSLAM